MLTPEKRALIKFIVVAEVRTPYESLKEKKSGDCLSTEDCQNSRSLCRFYSRSTRGRYEREIQASSGDDAESARFFDADFYEKLAASPP